jgi:hypothetical protein
VLLYPWDELLLLIAEGQEIEDDEGEAAAVRWVEMLQRL